MGINNKKTFQALRGIADFLIRPCGVVLPLCLYKINKTPHGNKKNQI